MAATLIMTIVCFGIWTVALVAVVTVESRAVLRAYHATGW